MKTTKYLISFMVLCIVLLGLGFYHIPTNELHPLRVQKEAKVEEKPQVDAKQLQCLADNIYYEAGSESHEGKAAVARVVMNRISHGFANTPCKVVYQTTKVKQVNEETEQQFWVKVCQFSWVCENKKSPNRNTHNYQSSLQIAYDVLAYDKYREVLPKSVLFFHNKTVINQFPHEVVKVIGNHIFYKKKHGKHRKSSQYVKKSRETQFLDGEIQGRTLIES